MTDVRVCGGFLLQRKIYAFDLKLRKHVVMFKLINKNLGCS